MFDEYLNLLIIAGSGVFKSFQNQKTTCSHFVEKNQTKRTANSVISNTPKEIVGANFRNRISMQPMRSQVME